MEKKFVKVGQLKEGGYLLIEGVAVQIKSIEKSKPGKHGAAKARITGVGIFNGQKKNMLTGTTDEGEVPIVMRGNAQVNAVMGDNLNVMDMTSYEVFDAPKPKDVPGIKQGDEVEYMRLDDQIRVIRRKGAE
ncbi:MAG: translation initiation factor IF-5A [Candidatus Diapherotrites archaeon]|nr:translation initiation factor IF-5A [Candidatus Diapherotrites archaeon]